MMQDKDLINSKSKDKGSTSRSQSMNDQSHYKQAETKTNDEIRQPPTRMSIEKIKFSTMKEFDERDLNIYEDWKTTTGKEISNPFMAGSLPKNMLHTFIHKLQLEGIECLPIEEIFTELAIMGYEKPSTKLTFYKAFFSSQWKFLIHTILQCISAKRTSWNDFSSSMASAVTCLSTGRKFNFSKYIFDSLVRNVDSSTKFYMYLRFLQLMIRKRVGDLLTHTTKYTSPAMTQKVFTNMRRVGKGFFGVETPLFEGMIVEQQVDEGDAEVNVDDVPAIGVAVEAVVSVGDDVVPTAVDESSIPSPTPPTPPPQPSQD
nr:hypothetical protein [Tanacetum cinerariifolium]